MPSFPIFQLHYETSMAFRDGLSTAAQHRTCEGSLSVLQTASTMSAYAPACTNERHAVQNGPRSQRQHLLLRSLTLCRFLRGLLSVDTDVTMGVDAAEYHMWASRSTLTGRQQTDLRKETSGHGALCSVFSLTCCCWLRWLMQPHVPYAAGLAAHEE